MLQPNVDSNLLTLLRKDVHVQILEFPEPAQALMLSGFLLKPSP
jgi:hypothetical protein